MDSIPNPSGLCECGCGQPTQIAKDSDRKDRRIKGQFMRYVNGHQGRHYPSAVERFWANVDTSGGFDACWPWLGSKNREGYGVFGIGRRQQKAPRFAFDLHNPPLKDDEFACHTCDNPACCNPRHIFRGDAASNNLDKVQKGRQSKGEQTRSAKLTEQQVRDIRRQHADEGLSGSALARMYGLTASTVNHLLIRRTWKHLE